MNDPWDTLARAITRLGDRIDALPGIREATVTATAPLEVTFDTDTLGTLVFGSLARNLQPGDRVLTVRLARYVWVLGRRGGDRGSYAYVKSSPSSSDAPGTFDQGVTVSDVNNGNSDGYPSGANLATLLTFRYSNVRAFQLLSAKTSPMLWHRGVNAGGTEWEPWAGIGHGILYVNIPLTLRSGDTAPFVKVGTTELYGFEFAANKALRVGGTVKIPFGWNSARVRVYYTHLSGSGNVRFARSASAYRSGATPRNFADVTNTATVGAAGVVNSGLITGDLDLTMMENISVSLARIGTSDLDTLEQPVYILGVGLEKTA